MLFMRNGNRLQQLFFTNMRYLFFCITIFSVLSSHSHLLAQSSSENMSSAPKALASDEFKTLVENIYELLLHKHSTDDVIEMLDDDEEDVYDVQKLVTHLHSLLGKQNSKESTINTILGNEKFKEYFARKNLLTKMTIGYIALKAVAVLIAIVVVLYLLYKIWVLLNIKLPFSGESGFIPALPKPKNQCDANISDNNEFPHPEYASQSIEIESEHGHETFVQEAQETLAEALQSSPGIVLVSENAGPATVQRQQASSVTCIERISVNYELREEARQRVESVIRICPDFVEPLHVDISLRATEGAGANQPIDTRKLREIVDERISACERLLNSEQLRKK